MMDSNTANEGRTSATEADVPLVFDLDRTLIVDDSLELCLMRMARRQRSNLLKLLCRLPSTGWTVFKREIFAHANLDPRDLVFDPEVLKRLREARDAGRSVWIATASPQQIADTVAEFLGLPPERAIGTTTHNIKGSAKAEVLVERFGRGGFDYVGDSAADLAVWKQARGAIAVARSGTARRRFARIDGPVEVIDRTASAATARDWLRLIRPHQWPKNVLIFLPLFTSHRWLELQEWIIGLWALVAMSLAASSVYVVNDALDWSSDRRHPRKSRRPIAAGRIRPATALAVSGVLLVLALGVAAAGSLKLFACIGAYLLIATSYSLYFKQRLLIDTVILSFFYIIRIVTGGVTMGIHLSAWLVSFAGFAFFSAAMVKRFCELKRAQEQERTHNELRAYSPDDLPIIAMLGVGSGLAACLVLSLYVSSDIVQKLYDRPEVLWIACPLFFYWMGRIWLLANRGFDVEDPVDFAFRDRVSYVVLVALVIVVCLAI